MIHSPPPIERLTDWLSCKCTSKIHQWRKYLQNKSWENELDFYSRWIISWFYWISNLIGCKPPFHIRFIMNEHNKILCIILPTGIVLPSEEYALSCVDPPVLTFSSSLLLPNWIVSSFTKAGSNFPGTWFVPEKPDIIQVFDGSVDDIFFKKLMTFVSECN